MSQPLDNVDSYSKVRKNSEPKCSSKKTSISLKSYKSPKLSQSLKYDPSGG